MMGLSVLISVVLSSIALISGREFVNEHSLRNSPSPPSWPESYSLTYVFTLPYTSKIQPDPIKYTVQFFRDASDIDRRQVRVETLNGTNTMIAIAGDAEYEIQPEKYERHCNVYPGGHGAASANALPDISDWTFSGEEELDLGLDLGLKMTSVWQYQRLNEGKITLYKFYVSVDEETQQPQPIRLHMLGPELTMGSHYSEYIVDYLELIPDKPDPSLFDPPTLCEDGKIKGNGENMMSPAGFRMLATVPSVHYLGENEEYDAFLTTGHGRGRTHANLQEYRHRLSLFQKNSAMITQHNAQNKSFTMAMNKFGDWTREEFLAVMLPLKYKKLYQGFSKSKHEDKEHLQKHEYPYEPLTDGKKIPNSVDWRGSGADSGVKDQSLCGSCWSFGAVGAMESAWFHATGQSDRFSEQEVMDCSYEEGIAAWGCDGGGAWAGIRHIVDAGGISLLKDYQYLGITDYCRESRPITGKFKGFARIPMGDDLALMEAIYSRGPIAVSLDASSDAFTFYSSGVYYDTNCKYEYDDLDHAMVAVGYGSELSGDYWLVKNSWSDLWGDKGYIKVSRDNHGCGASTDALYALVDDDDALVKREIIR
jgi:C1A family cysteine protease